MISKTKKSDPRPFGRLRVRAKGKQRAQGGAPIALPLGVTKCNGLSTDISGAGGGRRRAAKPAEAPAFPVAAERPFVPPYAPEEILDEVERVAAHGYLRRYRSPGKALQAFARRIEGDPAVQVHRTLEAVAAKMKRSFRPLRRANRNVSPGLRFQVLQRDRFKCTACGASPADDPRCKLHVDHVTPWSKGGKTVIANLRTLCAACNLGRGARVG